MTPVEVQILAIKGFHGNLESPEPIRIRLATDQHATMSASGAGVLGAEVAKLRAE